MKRKKSLNAGQAPDRGHAPSGTRPSGRALKRITSSFSSDVLRLIGALVLFVTVLCAVYELTLSRRAANAEAAVTEAFDSITGADGYSRIDADYESAYEGVSVKAVYEAELGDDICAYCFLTEVNGEESFDLAVCLDAYSSVILGVSVVDGTRSAGSGNYVLWLESGYLDMYSNMNESYAYSVPVLDSAASTTSAVKNAVLACMDIVAAINGGADI